MWPDCGKAEPPAQLKRDGFLAFADGVNWNPGAGRGFYVWNASSSQWEKLGDGGGGGGSGDMTKAVYDIDDDGIVDNADKVDGHNIIVSGDEPSGGSDGDIWIQVMNAPTTLIGDMLKSVYDTDNDGVVDNAKKLDGYDPDDFAPANHTHQGMGGWTLLHSVETDTSETVNTTNPTDIFTYDLPPNTYSKILIETIVQCKDLRDAASKVDWYVSFYEGDTQKKTFYWRTTADSTSGIDSGQVISPYCSLLIDGGQTQYKTLKVQAQANVANSSVGYMGKMFRVWGIP